MLIALELFNIIDLLILMAKQCLMVMTMIMIALSIYSSLLIKRLLDSEESEKPKNNKEESFYGANAPELLQIHPEGFSLPMTLIPLVNRGVTRELMHGLRVKECALRPRS